MQGGIQQAVGAHGTVGRIAEMETPRGVIVLLSSHPTAAEIWAL